MNEKMMTRTRDFLDRHVIELIMDKYGLPERQAVNKFILSDTYQMMSDQEQGVCLMSPLAILDMWENEQISGDPRNSVYIREA